MQRLIILRGCMGSGKTTLASKFQSFENKTAVIKIDNFKELFNYFEKDARQIVHGTANATLDYLLSKGFSVVMEGVFQNTDFIQQAVDIAIKYGVPHKVFYLNAPLQVLKERDQNREEIKLGTREPLDIESLRNISKKLEQNIYEDSIMLKTEKYTIDELVELVENSFTTA